MSRPVSNVGFRNIEWDLWATDDEQRLSNHDQVRLAVLMDIRRELQRLNSLLHCYNCTSIPATLRSIQRKLPSQPRKAKK